MSNLLGQIHFAKWFQRVSVTGFAALGRYTTNKTLKNIQQLFIYVGVTAVIIYSVLEISKSFEQI